LSGFVVPRPDYPPLAHTGGFGEPTCQACHMGEALNAAGGTLRIEGAPETWRPGERYRLVVVLQRDSLARGGFELAARFLSGGGQAGSLSVADTTLARVTADTATHVQFAHHSMAGTRGGAPGEKRWVVTWRAPAHGGPVAFHAAAVAANDDDSNLGDLVYTATATSRRP
jgi:hypothetical protein